MRNLKKILALVMALAMSLSLVTIANAVDFTDSDDINYEEAVEVMSAIGVINGMDDGSFDPNGTLTREQAAKLVTYMLMGDNAENLGVEGSTFKDVAATRWSASAIEYCVAMGIIDGAGDGNFYPAGQLTANAFAKVLLTALGYDSEAERLTGTSWSVNTAALAMEVGLNSGIEDLSWTAVLTREEAAQMALNAIKAPMVAYEDGMTVIVDGTPVSVGSGNAYYVTTTLAREQRISKQRLSNTNDYTVEFGERYFPKLVLNVETDVFGRPSHTWVYDGEELGTYVDYDLRVASYTEKVTGKDLYDLLGRSVVENDDYTLTVYIDGESDVAYNDAIFNMTQINRNNKATLGETGNGVLTEVFVDNDAETVVISIINTYLAKATSDYSEKKDEVSFDVYGITEPYADVYVKDSSDKTPERMPITGEDFAVAENVLENDIYLVKVADGEIQIIDDVDTVADVVLTSFSKGNYVVADGEQYDYADAIVYDPDVLDEYTSVNSTINLKDLTYNLYLDAYGYMIGVDLVEVPNNYLFLTGIDSNGSNLSAVAADAAAIFLDGQIQGIKVNMDKSNLGLSAGQNFATINKWYTYTVNNSGVYTLEEVPATIGTNNKVAQSRDTTNGKEIDLKHVSLAGSGTYTYVYGNDATVYLNADLKAIVNRKNDESIIINGVSNVVTGVKNANLTIYDEDTVQGLKAATDTTWAAAADGDVSYGAYTLYKSNGYIIASVVVGQDDAASKNLVYVHSGDVNLEAYSSTDDEWTWSRKVIADGEEVTLYERGDTLTYLDDLGKGNWYQISYNSNGDVIGQVQANIAGGPLGSDFVNAIANVPVRVATPGVDTVLYQQSWPDQTGLPYMIGSTLYASRTSNTGFFVAEDVNVVLIQPNDNVTTTTYETGVDNLEDMLSDLNKSKLDGNYDYTINAILEEGAATVVIINDANDETGNGGQTITGEPTVPAPTINGLYIDVPVADGFQGNVLNKAIAALQAKGYTVTGVANEAGNTGEYVLTASKDNIPGWTFTTNTITYYAVTFDVGPTAAGYTNQIVGNKTVYMTAGSSVVVTFSGSGWNNVTPTITSGVNLTIARNTDNSVKVTAGASFNAAVASAVIDFTI